MADADESRRPSVDEESIKMDRIRSEHPVPTVARGRRRELETRGLDFLDFAEVRA
jgi:hypothetical protein